MSEIDIQNEWTLRHTISDVKRARILLNGAQLIELRDGIQQELNEINSKIIQTDILKGVRELDGKLIDEDIYE